MISVIDNETDSGNSVEMAAIDAFNAQLQSAGQLIMAEGLASPRASVVVDNRGGAGLVTPGPLHDTEQYVSGFWIIEAADRDAALALAAEGSRACNRVVELRPFFGGYAPAMPSARLRR
ncbi:YciI family protein [Microcella sp.]|uniref:YciI family protein n=1 Tax=Microcella sp. TaxID=1913979 RepID=UPI003F702907